ncbi:hypothetical protein C8R43DRAFT_909534, partial [Mycena crocata]
RRAVYWAPLPWEVRTAAPPVVQIFPPADLLRDLVDTYFAQLNIFAFVLHRPTFERALADNLHMRNPQFGAIVLTVCAVASKNSPDERVLLPGEGELSAGWAWFRQIRRPFSSADSQVSSASVYELQLCCLYIMFQRTSSDIESGWLLSGVGILHAQDIGAHNRGRAKATPNTNGREAEILTIEDELTKRCSFFLSHFNVMCSDAFGRPGVMSVARCVVDTPAVCDDDYFPGEPNAMQDAEEAWMQPGGKPALSAYNLAYIKLIKIFAFSRRALFFVKSGTQRRAAKFRVASAQLNKWAEEIPEHLLWNPYMKDDVFFDSSCMWGKEPFTVQILVHRHFLQSAPDQAPSASAFISLAICANTARSTVHVADVKSRRGFLPAPHLAPAVFDSAIVLILNISGGARSRLSIDTERELIDVYKCMNHCVPRPRQPSLPSWADTCRRVPTSGGKGCGHQIGTDVPSWTDNLSTSAAAASTKCAYLGLLHRHHCKTDGESISARMLQPYLLLAFVGMAAPLVGLYLGDTRVVSYKQTLYQTSSQARNGITQELNFDCENFWRVTIRVVDPLKSAPAMEELVSRICLSP